MDKQRELTDAQKESEFRGALRTIANANSSRESIFIKILNGEFLSAIGGNAKIIHVHISCSI